MGVLQPEWMIAGLWMVAVLGLVILAFALSRRK